MAREYRKTQLNPGWFKKGILSSPNPIKKGEHRGLDTQFKKGQTSPWKGKKFNKESIVKLSLSHKKMTENTRKRLLEVGVKGRIKQQNMKQPTSLEKAVYDYLLLKGILFEKQKVINGRFIVDAYIPSLNLVIEADGKYWHDFENIKKKDKAENAYLRKCGYNLIRLTEEEIKNREFERRLF